MKRICPVCRIVPLIRSDLRTCSKVCAKEWGSWSPESKVRVLNQQNMSSAEILEDLRKKGIIKPLIEVETEAPGVEETSESDQTPEFMKEWLDRKE